LLGLLTADPGARLGYARAAGTLSITGHATLTAGGPDDAEIDTLVKQRDAFRNERNFKEADRIRRELTERGIVIEDAAGGARWRRSR